MHPRFRTAAGRQYQKEDFIMKRTYRRPALVLAGALLALLFLAHHAAAASTAMPGAGQAPLMSEPSKAGPNHSCGCECCKDGRPCGKECPCGHGHGGSGKPAMKEGMKKHLEEARKSVAALREHAKKMEAITDQAEFRKAAIVHFRMQDDLQESHVKHMESMMGSAGRGHGHHGHGCQEPCKDCPGK